MKSKTTPHNQRKTEFKTKTDFSTPTVRIGGKEFIIQLSGYFWVTRRFFYSNYPLPVSQGNNQKVPHRMR